MQNQTYSEYIDNSALTNAEVRVLELGYWSGYDVIDSRRYDKVTFTIISSHICNLKIQSLESYGSVNYDNIVNTNFLAATVYTPYLLPAPFNQTGFITIPAAVLRFVLTDTAGTGHSYTRVYVKIYR